MDLKESLELYQKGKHAWNAWACKMIEERKVLEVSGEWKHTWHLRNAKTNEWIEKAKADFRNNEFLSFADFRQYCFPGDALFQRAVFKDGGSFASALFSNVADFRRSESSNRCIFASVNFCGTTRFEHSKFKDEITFRGSEFLGEHNVDFNDTQFDGYANFGECHFKATAEFQYSRFSKGTRFDDVFFTDGANFANATFSGFTLFGKTAFSHDVSFDHCCFEDEVSFGQTTFSGRAGFSGVKGKAIVLDHPSFAILPDFTGAHFDEAPVFDGVDLDPKSVNKSKLEERFRVQLPEKWRALRKLANQGHDHERELLFFKGEVTARRGTRDTWRHCWFWVGWVYQVLSDFGRSITRPIVWLGICIFSSMVIYLLPNRSIWEQPFFQQIPCEVGSGDVRMASFLLSLHYTLPVAGIASTGKIQHAYACLYGLKPNTLDFQNRTTSITLPDVPYYMVILGFCQSVVSAVLVFLILLAVRNRFRIK